MKCSPGAGLSDVPEDRIEQNSRKSLTAWCHGGKTDDKEIKQGAEHHACGRAGDKLRTKTIYFIQNVSKACILSVIVILELIALRS